MTAVTLPSVQIQWEKLSDDFVLQDDPVDHIYQPALAAALTESLAIAGKIPDNAVTTTNYARSVLLSMARSLSKRPTGPISPICGFLNKRLAASIRPTSKAIAP